MTQPVTLIQSAHLIALYDCSQVHARHYALLERAEAVIG